VECFKNSSFHNGDLNKKPSMTSFPQAHIQQIASALRGSDASPQEALTALLDVTDSRAIGLWRAGENSLRLAGFSAKPDMPQEVREGFQSATREVPFTQTGLGIIQTVQTRQPAIANIETGKDALPVSASWLARFNAVMSLAVPIIWEEELIGVLAMSTANPFVEQDDTWRLLTEIARQLGR
jgi:GAF domain-containing protein